jgi:hypothetical protein
MGRYLLGFETVEAARNEAKYWQDHGVPAEVIEDKAALEALPVRDIRRTGSDVFYDSSDRPPRSARRTLLPGRAAVLVTDSGRVSTSDELWGHLEGTNYVNVDSEPGEEMRLNMEAGKKGNKED